MFVVTREWIDANKPAKGGHIRSQIVALGEDWPATKGWMTRAAGREISDDAKLQFESGGRDVVRRDAKLLRRLASDLNSIARSKLATGGDIFPPAAVFAAEILGKPSPGDAKQFIEEHLDELLTYCAQHSARKGTRPKRARLFSGGRQAPPSSGSAQARVEYVISRCSVDPNSDEFLRSFEWRAARMIAIKRWGPVCMCCGASPKTGAVINVDHIKSRKTHPHLALDQENLQILCSDCNAGKGAWDQTDWRPKNKAPRKLEECIAEESSIHSVRCADATGGAASAAIH